jgi:hypothetical protein
MLQAMNDGTKAMPLQKVWSRVRADYFAPDRYNDYRAMIVEAQRRGFRLMTLSGLHALLSAGATVPDRVFVHRHDIDTDVSGARTFFEIEQSLGVTATHFFRLSTFDAPLMREIHAYGSEVGYHYEEVATVAKRRGLTTRASVEATMGEIRQEFERNFNDMEQKLGFKLISAASHGDFANRRLAFFNFEIVQDAELRRRLGLQYEAYDDILMNYFDTYISDSTADRSFKGGDPMDAMANRNRICLLSHPRHWRTSGVENTKDNVLRAVEEVRWRVAARG